MKTTFCSKSRRDVACRISTLALAIILAMSATTLRAQVRIGGLDNPHGSAILDLNANDATDNGTQGLALPRVALTATNVAAPITTPIKGLQVYNTATDGSGGTAVSPGIYYWDGTKWATVGAAGAAGAGFRITTQPVKFSWTRKQDAYGDPNFGSDPDWQQGGVSKGSTLSLSVEVAGNSGSLTYKWYLVNKKPHQAATEVGSNSATFPLPNSAQNEQTGGWGMDKYYVTITDGTTGTVLTSDIAEVAYGCGARTVDGNWLQVACYNHGVPDADKARDPFTYAEGDNTSATSIGAGGILGPFYQWGRNDWVPRTDNSAQKETGPTSALAKGDNQPTGSSINKFITGSATYNYDWRQNAWDYLWYANCANPCTDPWWMPTQTDWGSITSGGTNRVLTAQTTANTMEFASGMKFKPDGTTVTLFLPAASHRSHNGTLSNVGTDGNYWSSTVSGSMAFGLYFDSGSLYPGGANVRSHGRSVRCVRQ